MSHELRYNDIHPAIKMMTLHVHVARYVVTYKFILHRFFCIWDHDYRESYSTLCTHWNSPVIHKQQLSF